MSAKDAIRDLKRFKLHDIYTILKWAFRNQRRPSFLPAKTTEKPFIINFILIINFEKNKFVLPALRKIKLNEKILFSELPFALTREVNIKELKPNLELITSENLDLILYIKMEQMYDNKIFINSDVNLVCPNLQNKFTKKTPYFLLSMDLEMVTTVIGKEVGRVSLLDHRGNIIYNKFVKPENEVLNYETEFSGLTKEILADGISFKNLRIELQEIIGENTTLLGHGLENDLSALGMYHNKIIDTSYLFLNTESRRVSLKQLARSYLKKSIHTGSHCSIEDANICLELLSMKIQEMQAIRNCDTKEIDIYDKIVYFSDFKEFTERYDYGLNIVTADSQTVKSNINKLNKPRCISFYFYEEGEKIIIEF